MKELSSGNRSSGLAEGELAIFFVRSARVREEDLEREKANTLPNCPERTVG